MIIAFLLTATLFAVPADREAGHDGPAGVPCVECHVRLPLGNNSPSLRGEVGAVCARCHPRHHNTDALHAHPLGRIPSMPVPPDMPLDSEGRIGCITCHAFHGALRDAGGKKRYYLRRTPGKTFCYSCHRSTPGASAVKP